MDRGSGTISTLKHLNISHCICSSGPPVSLIMCVSRRGKPLLWSPGAAGSFNNSSGPMLREYAACHGV